MDIHTELGTTHFALRQALLIYREESGYGTGGRAFGSVHDVLEANGEATLGPGRPATTEGIRRLKEAFDGPPRTHFLPERVLAYSEAALVWHVRPSRQRLFFESQSEVLGQVSGERFPVPGLVFKAAGEGAKKALSVWAIRQQGRPDPDTILYHAPFFNVYRDGRVCLGSMPLPEAHVPSAAETWTRSFFASAFTHGAGVRFLSGEPGYASTLEALAGSTERFPTGRLVRTGRRLRNIL